VIRTLSIAFVFVLAACGQTASAPAADTIAAEAQAADPHAAPVPSGEPVTTAFLVGTWGDNGNCASSVTFNADGAFRMQDGSGGTWTLEGDRVAMSGERGDFAVHVAKGDDNTLFIGQPDGSFGISQRC
jgi:hypothetical protein